MVSDMPLKSRFQIDIPATDILSYLFPEEKRVSDRPVWIDADDKSHLLSLKQALYWVKRFAIGLDKLGIEQNEAVMMYTRNHIFVPVFYLAVAGTGRIFTGCNPAYTVDETTYQLKNTGAKMLLVEPKFLDTVLKAAEKAGLSRNRIFLFSDKPCDPIDGVEDWRTLFGSEEQAERWQWRRMNAEQSKRTTAVL